MVPRLEMAAGQFYLDFHPDTGRREVSALVDRARAASETRTPFAYVPAGDSP